MIGPALSSAAAQALGFVAHLTLAVWLGSIIFFSFVSAPALFKTLGREDAGRAVRAIFPVYYRLGAACGGILVAAVALRALLAPEPRARRGVEAILGSAMLALTLYAWRVLLPRVEQARLRAEGKDPTDPTNLEQRYFRRLHAQSVRVNAAVLLLGLLCFTLASIPR
ncbi:MAG: DUF4149 domain-containing protein [Planctomycetota bacterium]